MANKQPHLSVIMRKRDGVSFAGEATAVTCLNNKGWFDVLPQHTHFVTTIKDTVIVRQAGIPEQHFSVPSGILHVRDNTVVIYVGI